MISRLHTRREAISRLGAGLGSLGLASVMQDAELLAAESKFQPHFKPRAKHIIQIFCSGGPSQVDTFDPKPDLVKNEGKTIKELDKDFFEKLPEVASEMGRLSRGKIYSSPFKFQKHGESGIEISELYPKLAKQADELCVIRSMHTDSSVHDTAEYMFNAGSGTFLRPSLGAWTIYGLGSENQNLPSFVTLHKTGVHPGGTRSWDSQFLPNRTAGTLVATPNFDVDGMIDSLRSSNTSLREQRRQLDLLGEMNARHLAKHPGEAQLESRMKSYETAFRMQIEASDAFDISREPKSMHDLYGDTHQGQQLLLARRLVERGVRFVQSWHLNWDTHDNNEERLKKLTTEEGDQALAALIQDLKQRDLLKDTLILWGGEFGRTPTSDENGAKNKVRGRDHHASAFTVWMAGGGVKGGHVHGKTDHVSAGVVEGAMHFHDLHATILHLMGLDHEKLTFRHSGRDFRLTDVHGKVNHDLFA